MSIVKSKLWKGGDTISSTTTIVTITNLFSAMGDGSALIDIYSWAYIPDIIGTLREFAYYEFRQLLVKKDSGVLVIVNSQIIEQIKDSSVPVALAWDESISTSDVLLNATLTGSGGVIEAFRRATVRYI